MTSKLANNINKNCQKINNLSKTIGNVRLTTTGNPNEFLNGTGNYSVPSEVNDFTVDGDLTVRGTIIVSASSRTMTGDDRPAAGRSFVQGQTVPPDVITGTIPTFSGKGSGIVTLSNAGSTITISASTTDPDFIEMEYVSGDEIYVNSNTNVVTKHTISIVTPQILTLTDTAPALGSGNSSITLVPNTRLDWNEVQTDVESITDVQFVGYDFFNFSTVNKDTLINARFVNSTFLLLETLIFFGLTSYDIRGCAFFNKGILLGSSGIKGYRESYSFGDGTERALLVSVGSSVIVRDNFIFNSTVGVEFRNIPVQTGTTSTIKDCTTGVISDNSRITLTTWTFTDCTTAITLSNSRATLFRVTITGATTGVIISENSQAEFDDPSIVASTTGIILSESSNASIGTVGVPDIDAPTGISISGSSSMDIAEITITSASVVGIDINATSRVSITSITSITGTGVGVRATNLSTFAILGGAASNTATTPWDPPVALTPNATGGNGVGY